MNADVRAEKLRRIRALEWRAFHLFAAYAVLVAAALYTTVALQRYFLTLLFVVAATVCLSRSLSLYDHVRKLRQLYGDDPP